MKNLIDLAGGVGTFFTTLAVSTEASESPWVSLLASAVSAAIYFALSLGVKALTTFLKKNGLITDDEKKEADKKAEDLADDGKINGSNDDEDK